MKRNFAFLAVPHAVFYDHLLSDGAKQVYAGLIAHDFEQKGHCLISQQRLGEELGISTRSVERYMAELKDARLITMQLRVGTARTTFVPLDEVYVNPKDTFKSTRLGPAKIGGSEEAEPDKTGGSDPPELAGPTLEEELLEKKPSGSANLAPRKGMDDLLSDELVRKGVERATRPKEPRRGNTRYGRSREEPEALTAGALASWSASKWAGALVQAVQNEGYILANHHSLASVKGQVLTMKDFLLGKGCTYPEIYAFIIEWFPKHAREVYKHLFKREAEPLPLGLVNARLGEFYQAWRDEKPSTEVEYEKAEIIEEDSECSST